jgi:hypothetical protein
MAEIDSKTKIIEDFEPLIELRKAFAIGNEAMFEGTLQELKDGLVNEYKEKIDDKVLRWANATMVLRFYDRPPASAYIQAKMLYRDGFFDATIMVARSIAEMICYDRLDGAAHPFGTTAEIERKWFKDLIKWLHTNDAKITDTVFNNLKELYALGNNYVHPKAGQNAKDDSLKALNLIGEAVFEIYGVKTFEEMIGRTVRTPYLDYPDICGGTNFWLTAFVSPQAAVADKHRHDAVEQIVGREPR